METRSLQAEFTNDGNTLSGIIPYDSPTTIHENGRTFTEVIRPGAFRSSMTSDVIATFNHNPGRLLGRTSSGTLSLVDGPSYLRFSVQLPESAADVRELVQRGDLKGASFTFSVRSGGEHWQNGTRELRDVNLFEIGPVVQPAYTASSLKLRSAGLSLMAMRLRLEENEHPGTT